MQRAERQVKCNRGAYIRCLNQKLEEGRGSKHHVDFPPSMELNHGPYLLLAEDEDALLAGETHFFHFSVFTKQH
jgi:hypothetical protein